MENLLSQLDVCDDDDDDNQEMALALDDDEYSGPTESVLVMSTEGDNDNDQSSTYSSDIAGATTREIQHGNKKQLKPRSIAERFERQERKCRVLMFLYVLTQMKKFESKLEDIRKDHVRESKNITEALICKQEEIPKLRRGKIRRQN